jgi:ubiquinone biosynthesis protein
MVRSSISAEVESPIIGRRQREREIAEVLARHGMAYFLSALGLGGLVAAERHLHPRHGEQHVRTPPQDVRLALQELGPTFIKLGQIISTRADLVPPEYQRELAQLQDDDPQVPADVIREILERELRRSLDEAFASFESEPLASASIGQAHAATLHDGAEVVVKIRRPGAVEEVQADLEIIQNFAAHASRHWKAARRIDLVGLVNEFVQALREELDYLHEARNAERFATNFAGDEDVQIPTVFWEFTTSRVITLQRIRGLKVSDVAALDAAGIDRPALAQRATRVTAKMVFEDGFFHADPHPGNFFIEAEGRIGIIDFGRVGIIDPALRGQLEVLLIALVRRDPDRLAGALIGLGASSEAADRSQLTSDLSPLMAELSGKGLGEISLGKALGELMEIARRNSLTVPSHLMLLLSVFGMEEGLAVGLDPGFHFAQALTPYVRHLLLGRLSPAALGRRLEHLDMDLAELTVELPHRLRRLMDAVSSGGFEVQLRAGELEPLMARAERLGNRIAASVIAGALIDALAEVARSGDGGRRISRTRRLMAGVATAAAVGGYTAWRHSPGVAGLARAAGRRVSPRPG